MDKRSVDTGTLKIETEKSYEAAKNDPTMLTNAWSKLTKSITQSAFTCTKLTIETRCEICSKLTIKTIEQSQWCQ